ncbi:hypothetical protein OPT61_g1428 [Boeremia exigua]|uniref:Uncharacterized protein n=1 Tax=Boeremia exigua TaxID=749465 RepID=A0ACC2IQ93_9PLEO|nr:hypothetical protein OPT61_g1428 [Boeremia exigua]
MIDDTKRRGQAMKLLEDAGIYVFTSVSTRFNTINRMDPYSSYHSTAMREFFQSVDAMAPYPNTLGILAGVGIVNSKSTEKAVPVIKAVVRDLKRYMGLQNAIGGQRILPVGYSAATVEQLDTTSLDYLSLGDPASSIDFWTCNCYSWAGQSNMQVSGYEALTARLQNAALPVFMSEYGTNIPNPRLFQETAALYSLQMSRVFSGGCAYEFWQGPNNYGMVELVDQEQDRTTSASERRREGALARSDNPMKTAEKRETERGPLSIFHDFVNFKMNLNSTRDIERIWEGDIMEREAAERMNRDTTQRSWPWEPEFQIPETVVDWGQLEDQINVCRRVRRLQWTGRDLQRALEALTTVRAHDLLGDLFLRGRSRPAGRGRHDLCPAPGHAHGLLRLGATGTAATHPETSQGRGRGRGHGQDHQTAREGVSHAVLPPGIARRHREVQRSQIVVEALTRNVKEDHIREIFGKYGTIKDLRMPMNPVFNVNRGTAYIMYEEIEDAERAIAKMHEAQLDGAKIQVSIVLPRRRFSQTPPQRRGGPPPRFHDDYNGHGAGGPPGAYRPPPMGGYGGGRGQEGVEVDAEAETLVTGLAHTQGPAAGHHEEACHAHHTAGRRQGHHHVAEEGVAAEVVEATGEETHRREEADEEAGGGEAQVMILTTVHDPEAAAAAKAEAEDRDQHNLIARLPRCSFGHFGCLSSLQAVISTNIITNLRINAAIAELMPQSQRYDAQPFDLRVLLRIDSQPCQNRSAYYALAIRPSLGPVGLAFVPPSRPP